MQQRGGPGPQVPQGLWSRPPGSEPSPRKAAWHKCVPTAKAARTKAACPDPAGDRRPCSHQQRPLCGAPGSVCRALLSISHPRPTGLPITAQGQARAAPRLLKADLPAPAGLTAPSPPGTKPASCLPTSKAGEEGASAAPKGTRQGTAGGSNPMGTKSGHGPSPCTRASNYPVHSLLRIRACPATKTTCHLQPPR